MGMRSDVVTKLETLNAFVENCPGYGYHKGEYEDIQEDCNRWIELIKENGVFNTQLVAIMKSANVHWHTMKEYERQHGQ
jgi:hypothetical protein